MLQFFLQRSNLIEFETNVPNVMLELVRIVKLKDVSFIWSILIQMLPEKAKSFLKKADIHLYKSKSDLIKGEENSVISIVFTKTQLSVNISEEIKNKEELLPTRIEGEKWIEHLQSLFLTSKQISLNKNIQKFPIAENEVEEYAKNMNELASHEEDESEIEEMSNEGRVFTIEEVLKNFS